jgi:hypothetical protein
VSALEIFFQGRDPQARRWNGYAGLGTSQQRWAFDRKKVFKIREQGLFSICYEDSRRTGQTAENGTFELPDRESPLT